MDLALALICVKSDDLSVLWCINHIEYVPLEHIFFALIISFWIWTVYLVA